MKRSRRWRSKIIGSICIPLHPTSADQAEVRVLKRPHELTHGIDGTRNASRTREACAHAGATNFRRRTRRLVLLAVRGIMLARTGDIAQARHCAMCSKEHHEVATLWAAACFVRAPKKRGGAFENGRLAAHDQRFLANALAKRPTTGGRKPLTDREQPVLWLLASALMAYRSRHGGCVEVEDVDLAAAGRRICRTANATHQTV